MSRSPRLDPRQTTPRESGAPCHAIVVGGSIAGLLAARILTDYFVRVTILDRDVLPETPVARRGAPQAHHNHVLLLRGRQVMEELFPGLQRAVIADGGLLMDMASELAWFTPWGWGARFSSPLVMLACSRALLEWRLRRMLGTSGAVAFTTGTGVNGLIVDQGRVRGVHTDAGDIDADLVVDASGRGTHASRWLEDAGFPPPRETVVNAFLGYASRIYRPAPDSARWWKGIYIQAAPPEHPRVGVILPIEGGLWHVTLGGGDRQYPPTDDAGFLEFALSLRAQALYDALQSAHPCSPIYATRSTENRRRHFESNRLPEGFVVTGDAACVFNPVYGQGMTTAAIGAQTLDTCLEVTRRRTGLPHGNGLSRRFQAALAWANNAPWMLAIGEDLRYRGTEGARADLRIRLMHRYMDMIGRLTTSDPAVRLRLLRAFHMIAPPESLFSPRMMWRAFRGGRSVAAPTLEPGSQSACPQRLDRSQPTNNPVPTREG
jgi:2-polyprenyl-6-methoxyphenol hydroxylase-like FAD-dependent oxidoreductase